MQTSLTFLGLIIILLNWNAKITLLPKINPQCKLVLVSK